MLTTRQLLVRSLHLTTRLTGPAALRPSLVPLATKASCSRAKYASLNCEPTVSRPSRATPCSLMGFKRHVCTSAPSLQESDGASQPQLAAPRIAGAAPDHDAMMLRISWATGGEEGYPLIWMRDNCQCPACFHPTAKNRLLSMGALAIDVRPTAVQVSNDGQEVEVRWSDDHVSCFTGAWLHDRTLGTFQREKQSENFRLKMKFWGSEKQGQLRRFSFPLLRSDDKSLLNFLEVLEMEGVAVINDMPCETDLFKMFTKEKIGYTRPTQYGITFSVRSKKTASNVAYTSSALDMHNDMVYLEEKPGIQIMHCISQTKGRGGDHLLVDSFHAANQMREKHPELFRVLTNTVVTFTDVGFDFVGHFHATARRTIIQCDDNGNVIGTNISNHSRDSHFAVTPEETVTWYKAYLIFWDLLNDPKNYITNKLQDGEMIVLDNYRVLHGRTAYQESEGERHIVSGYWDWDTVKSRRRVLRAALSNS